MKKIGLLMMGLLVFSQAEFKRGDNNLTVIDTDTQLEWQDNYEDNQTKIDYWNNSINYCENLELDGKNDWRLPNINELKSIVVDTQYAPTINNIFKYIESTSYWSSTKTSRDDNRYAYVIKFDDGYLGTQDARQPSYYSNSTANIRCVRDVEN